MKKAKIIEKVKEWMKTTGCGCYDYDECPHLADNIRCDDCHADSIVKVLTELLPEDEESEET